MDIEWVSSRNINGLSPILRDLVATSDFDRKTWFPHNECVYQRNYGLWNRVAGKYRKEDVRCTVI